MKVEELRRLMAPLPGAARVALQVGGAPVVDLASVMVIEASQLGGASSVVCLRDDHRAEDRRYETSALETHLASKGIALFGEEVDVEDPTK